MNQQEINDIKRLIVQYKNILSPGYKTGFEEWEVKKDKVIKTLRFKEELDVVITYAILLDTVGVDFYNRAGFGNQTREQLIKTRGNTKLIDQISGLYTRAENLRKNYKSYFKKFNKEYLKQNPKR